MSRPPLVRLSAEEVHADILGGGTLFLGRYDEDTVRRELGEAGILDALAARGFEGPRLEMHFEAGQHVLRLLPARGRQTLVDLRLGEDTLPVPDPAAAGGLPVLSLLSVHWLSLQDPRARFTRDKPRLPGQVHPGLGLGRRVFERLHRWARAWGKDGLANHPEYFHNAVFYAGLFRFLSPEEQGRFEALRRDLGPRPVAEASFAVAEGRVREAAGDRAFAWRPGPMIAPLSEPLTRRLASVEYARAAGSARDAVEFVVREPGAPPR